MKHLIKYKSEYLLGTCLIGLLLLSAYNSYKKDIAIKNRIEKQNENFIENKKDISETSKALDEMIADLQEIKSDVNEIKEYAENLKSEK